MLVDVIAKVSIMLVIILSRTFVAKVFIMLLPRPLIVSVEYNAKQVSNNCLVERERERATEENRILCICH